ncbi:MAG: hypothetical protein HY706_11135 [Candidatus Hydrogenedentes bacterium]|nr:hypothetical protein [Candidatus Hydrogenedentota bacterium]
MRASGEVLLIVLLLLGLFSLPSFGATGVKDDALVVYLTSGDVASCKTAFLELAKHRKKYAPQILEKLRTFQNDPDPEIRKQTTTRGGKLPKCWN